MTTEPLPSVHNLWLTDSRQTLDPSQAANTVFFAIRGEHHDGHAFVGDLYRKGVRHFVVERQAITPARRAEFAAYTDAQFSEVDSSLQALQSWAAEHRAAFGRAAFSRRGNPIPVVGITGSNGKTIVKEWLAQLLSGWPPPNEFVIAKSPRSYNSQLGVPLSMQELTNQHTLGIFEAGISKPGEMAALEAIIRPTIGIFTNIGTAHDEGFRSHKQKIAEKLRLFIHAETLIYSADYTDIDEEVRLLLKAVNPNLRVVTWSLTGRNATYQLVIKDGFLLVNSGRETGETETFKLPFDDAASVENLIHCLMAVKLLTTLDASALQQRLNRLRPVSMRLELKEGINNCVLIDDSYNNDVAGLQLALRFLNQQNTRNHTIVILSDVLQSGQREDELYGQVADLMRAGHVTQFIGIGPVVSRNAHLFAPNSRFYPDTTAFLAEFPVADLRDAAILVKGARPFSFERIVSWLQRKAHGTVLEINLDALTSNLNYYREKVGQQTKIMVMVKAFAYGSGSAEVAQLLQFHRVDYLAVAYADEGVSLRENGITLPIMVMNPAGSADRPETFAQLLNYHLEPEVYSMTLLRAWGRFVAQRQVDENSLSPVFIHLKIDTGMHRLGFLESELPDLVTYLNEQPNLRVATVFSHLAGADEAQFNDFSRQQFETFERCVAVLTLGLGYQPTRHLLNSAGIVRFPDYKLDMVRLGIGLYGVESSQIDKAAVQPVGTLKTIISQIKTVPAGESVGYSRRGVLDHNARIATLAIGYADGYDRRLGNGIGSVWVNGTPCPTVGNVCMDMTMIDVTAASAAEGDEVIIFGRDITITQLARQIGTIPYEILTGVSERVKRVFYKEGN
ncbi:MAG: bifunctional UDP-N-acetylmuramoyl-tripeptide:D-alanyl-D-alanine ligase/alanine racemase [Spirosoma sp.]|nr:bifunctional UDP-N-acetylmuramoyl-tripeptide:D-alanyl-D-alanine ligase/alanine racemase [Spirosoma sp.]